MGQKFTITESERNQIRGLYEQPVSGGTTPQSGTTQGYKSKHIQDIPNDKVISQVKRLGNLFAEITTKDNKNYTLTYLNTLHNKIEDYNVIFFEGDSDTLKDLNSVFKNAFSSPTNTEKTISLDSNVITLKTRKMKLMGFGKEQVEVMVYINGNNRIGGFGILPKEIDLLFPTNLPQQQTP